MRPSPKGAARDVVRQPQDQLGAVGVVRAEGLEGERWRQARRQQRRGVVGARRAARRRRRRRVPAERQREGVVEPALARHALRVRTASRPDLGFGRIVASEKEAPNMLVILV